MANLETIITKLPIAIQKVAIIDYSAEQFTYKIVSENYNSLEISFSFDDLIINPTIIIYFEIASGNGKMY